MRSKKPFFVASFLCGWTIVTYLLWIRQSMEVDINRKHMLNKLNYLETSIREEANIHDELVHRLVNVVKAKNLMLMKLTPSTTTAAAVIPVAAIIPVRPDKLINPEPIMNHLPNYNGQPDPLGAPKNKAITVAPIEPSPQGTNIAAVSHENVKEIPLEINKYFYNNNLSLILEMSKQHQHTYTGPVIPVLVFACNRISVSKCLNNLVEYRPNPHQFPIIVSQDCDDEATRNVILSYKEVILISHPDQSDIPVPPKEKKFKGYYKIARHYGWALNTTFKAGFDYVIIVEDDLNVAPDFYEYFMGTHELLKNDSSLWCISAWNDNGKVGNIDEKMASVLYRTDFFPGLGWMLSKGLWNELSPKWPKAFWDDWIRQPQQRNDRACIRPEISRTRTFGKIGVSNGLFFEKHLKYIKLCDEYIKFTQMNLTYLLKNNYDESFLKHVYTCPVVTFEELRRGILTTNGPVRIQYNTKDQFKRTAKLLGLMDDFKSGVPRTGYHGIISFSYNNQRVYLAPNSNWKGYDLSWS